MTIDTRAVGFELTEAIARHVDLRIGAALRPFSRRVFRAAVRVDDVNASRGGVDKRCTAVVDLRGHGAVVAEAVDADLYVAIDEAARIVRRSVLREAKRHLGRARKQASPPGVLVAP